MKKKEDSKKGIQRRNRRKLLISSVVVAIFIAILIWQTVLTSSESSQEVSAIQAYELIEKNQTNADFVMLDLRTPGEWRYGVIKDALLIDYMAPSFDSKFKELKKDKTYLVFCMSGSRSNKVVKSMTSSGFKTVYHLSEGMQKWYRENLPIVSP